MKKVIGTLILTAHAIYDNNNYYENIEKIGSSIVGSIVSGSKNILIASNSGSKAAKYEIRKLKEYISELSLPEDVKIDFLDLERLEKDLFEEFQNLEKYREFYKGVTGPFQIGVARDLSVQYFSGKRGYVLVLDDGMTPFYSLSEISFDDLLLRIKKHYVRVGRNIKNAEYAYMIFKTIGALDGGKRNSTQGEIYWNKDEQKKIVEVINRKDDVKKVVHKIHLDKVRRKTKDDFFVKRVCPYGYILYDDTLCIKYITKKEKLILKYDPFAGGRHIVPSNGKIVLEFQPPLSFNEDFNIFLPNLYIINGIYSSNPVRITKSMGDVWRKIMESQQYVYRSYSFIDNLHSEYGFIKNDKDVYRLPDILEKKIHRIYSKRLLGDIYYEYKAWIGLIRNMEDIAKFIRNHDVYVSLV